MLIAMGHIHSHITSFGFGHGPAPAASLVLDTRHLLRDPHVEPALRKMTGLDAPVVDRVRATPGALAAVDQLAAAARALLDTAGAATGCRVDIAVGCVGGRHRSVVIADELAARLRAAGYGVVVEHRDVARPVLAR